MTRNITPLDFYACSLMQQGDQQVTFPGYLWPWVGGLHGWLAATYRGSSGPERLQSLGPICRTQQPVSEKSKWGLGGGQFSLTASGIHITVLVTVVRSLLGP
jgi:hypothetical protein